MFYRPAVAAILRSRSGRILICERSDTPGAWQFPQGGVEAGESLHDALVREVLEEISLPRTAYAISKMKGPYRYQFPAGMVKKGFRGQSHHYFLLRLRGAKDLVNVTVRGGGEFRRVRWIRPDEFDVAWLPPMKRRAYRLVLRDFFGPRSRKYKGDSG